MGRFRLLFVLLFVVAAFCGTAVTSFAKVKPKCPFNGDYSLFFWDPNTDLAGVGYFSVVVDPATQCRSGVVLPGGILDCNFERGTLFEDFITSGLVFLETDGEGTMEIETISSGGICGTGDNALVLDISVVLGGKTVLVNSDGVEFVGSPSVPQAGYSYSLTGRADQCFGGFIAGCYDLRFWSGPHPTSAQPINGSDLASAVGDCSVCLDNRGHVTGGSCSCDASELGDNVEYLSSIVAGGYTLGGHCQSSTGYMWFTTSSQEICGQEFSLALNFALANGGSEIIGACDPSEYIAGNTSLYNAGYYFSCAFEGYLR